MIGTMARTETGSIVKTITKPFDVVLERITDPIWDEISSRLQSDKDSVKDQVKYVKDQVKDQRSMVEHDQKSIIIICKDERD